MGSVPGSLKRIMRGVSRRIEALCKEGQFSRDYVEDIRYRKHRRLHSRMLGILSSVGHDLGYMVDIERGLKPNEGSAFNPDILLWKNNEPILLLEYESTNSSDYRVIEKDLANFKISAESLLEDCSLPRFWVVLTTLPDKSVTSWSNWEGYSAKEYERIKENPRKFYKRWFIQEFSKVPNKLFNRSKLFLFNLNERGIELVFPSTRRRTIYPVRWNRFPD